MTSFLQAHEWCCKSSRKCSLTWMGSDFLKGSKNGPNPRSSRPQMEKACVLWSWIKMEWVCLHCRMALPPCLHGELIEAFPPHRWQTFHTCVPYHFPLLAVSKALYLFCSLQIHLPAAVAPQCQGAVRPTTAWCQSMELCRLSQDLHKRYGPLGP